MQIVVVRRGDSLPAFARLYGTTVPALMAQNGLEAPACLAVGQALLVPGPATIIVRPGDTLASIAERTGIPPDAWVAKNRLAHAAALVPGMRLGVPEVPPPVIEAHAYLEPRGDRPERDRAVVQEAAPTLTAVNVFYAQMTAAGGLVLPADKAVRDALEGTPAAPVLVVAPIEGGSFRPEIVRAFWRDPAWQEALARQLVAVARERGYRGVQFDFEGLAPDDFRRLAAWLKGAVLRLGRAGLVVSVALPPPQPGDPAEAYRTIGALVHTVTLKTDAWAHADGPPQPIAPLPELEAAVAEAVRVLPRKKLLLGAPLFGYDWALPAVQGRTRARALGLGDALRLACTAGAEVAYDERAEAPVFRYRDPAGRAHLVWFEDVRSLSAKFRLVRRYRLRGLSFWALGRPAPAAWALLREAFSVRAWPK
ncbi:LysM peptidoglycan-binding domain-containing protein [Hydrogenibacillus sp. N12]|uniref:LysM peptidoglycan-binding domain-containing protein n=1 Tax=Hydrogenibacillus sp. N12 TaxID=2866627 RepID=UPI001C7CEF11|nr:LysM peptidoglycan-binding domain-containing protein [Hydrogenibacillus sp. N12]QZA32770.1 LysM peptidoglycan-binding domain-containing protein [Hydrogenibacillus sp. N12]